MKNTNEINETIKVYSIENPELDRNDILNLMYILTIGHIGAPYISLESSIDP